MSNLGRTKQSELLVKFNTYCGRHHHFLSLFLLCSLLIVYIFTQPDSNKLSYKKYGKYNKKLKLKNMCNIIIKQRANAYHYLFFMNYHDAKISIT